MTFFFIKDSHGNRLLNHGYLDSWRILHNSEMKNFWVIFLKKIRAYRIALPWWGSARLFFALQFDLLFIMGIYIYDIIIIYDMYLERRCLGPDSAAARRTPCCWHQCWLRAELLVRRLNVAPLRRSGGVDTEGKDDTGLLISRLFRFTRWKKTNATASLPSPDLRFSDPVRPQRRATTCGRSRREREPPRSSWTGGGLVAWSPRCRRVRGSLPLARKRKITKQPFGLFSSGGTRVSWRTYVYLHVIEDVPRIQVDAVRFLVYGHHSEADVQGALHSSPGDLDREGRTFTHFQI